MNSGIFWRILVGLLFFGLIWKLIPPVSRILGLPLTGDYLTVVQVCVAAIVLFFILGGPDWPWWRRSA